MHKVVMHVALQGNTAYKLSIADSVVFIAKNVARDVAEQERNDQVQLWAQIHAGVKDPKADTSLTNSRHVTIAR